MANLRILVVEDESIVAKDIQDMLKGLGYTVPAIAFSGEQALKKAEEIQPDLVLMDIKLKGDIDGVEAARQIRGHFDIPVVYLTAYADKDTLERAKITEPFGYILKPFKEIELYTTIQIAIYRHKIDEVLRKDKADLEKVVGERTEELARLQKALEDARRLSDIGILAATVAHELRNPLGVIKIAVYNIKMEKKDPLLDGHLANIDKKISESDQIIKNLLSYARIEIPRFENIAVLDVLNESVAHCKEKYSKWEVTVEIKHNCKKSDEIFADPLHITELFSNILDNAYQAFSHSKGRIEIVLDYNKKADTLGMSFKDNGAGVEKQDLPKLFDPFFTKKSKGVGLGLTVCKQVVNLHRGKIDIKSTKGKGTVVYATLPIKRGAKNE